MPHPFDPQSARNNIVDRIGALERRPLCATLIASTLNEWTRIEHDLFEVAGAIGGTSTPVLLFGLQTNSWRTEPDVSVQQSFPVTDGVLRKLHAVQAVIDKRKWPQHLSLMWGEIFGQVRELAKQRNEIAHALWCYVDDYPQDVLRKDMRGETFVRYTPADFKKLIGRLNYLSGLLLEFHVQSTGNNAGLNLPAPLNFPSPYPSDTPS